MTDSPDKGPKERAYDADIAPLVERISDLCERHDIAMVATFEFDGDVATGNVDRFTTVCGVDEDDHTTAHLKRIARLLIAPEDLTMDVGEERPSITRTR